MTDGFPNAKTGFMTKIKKILEVVCHNCGKILADEVGHPFAGMATNSLEP